MQIKEIFKWKMFTSLRYKIILIFSIPIAVMMYFAYHSIESVEEKSKEAQAFAMSANITEATSLLIHYLQIERGLGSGYLVYHDQEDKKKIESIFHMTDDAYRHFAGVLRHSMKDRNILSSGEKEKIDIFQDMFSAIQAVRKQTLQANITFPGELAYYTKLNTLLITFIEGLTKPFIYLDNDTEVISLLQRLKENAGLERAHIYYMLRSNVFTMKEIDTIKALIVKENELKQRILDTGSDKVKIILSKYFDPKIENKLLSCRHGVFSYRYDQDDADKCFLISTEYIDQLKAATSELLEAFVASAKNIYAKSTRALITIYIIWIFSLFSLLFLAWVVYKMIQKEGRHIEDLRIASYAFDSQEAMTVTDTNGKIVRVNKAFTEITGYTADEVIGQNPNILKSNVHTGTFYKNMWKKLNKTGHWQGEIFNQRKNGEIYPERLSITSIKNEQGEITHYIAQFFDLSEIRETQKMVQHQADHDFLTGVLNRKSLMQYLEKAFKKAKKERLTHAFLFIDLDHFKQVNDFYGHYIGDQLLIEVVHKIKHCVRENDIVARMSGDEFAVLLLNLGSSHKKAWQKVANIAQNIIDAIAQRHTIEGVTVKIGASIGIRMFPDGEESINDIVLHADKAMYRAKKNGRGHYLFFDDKIKEELHRMMRMELEIKEGLKHNEFCFYYQPKIDLKKNEITGAEMLVRWNHPQKGILGPEYFLTVAEGMGVVGKFFILALHQGCALLTQNVFHGTLAINVDVKEFMDPNFEQLVIDVLQHHHVNPKHIEFEITESMIIKEFDIADKKIRSLQEKGFKFAIDDFGTGYSSITYLQRLPVDTLKLDKSFFDDISKPESRELIKMVISLAKIFNINVVAEGIEEKEQLDFIRSCGADSYQGFLFSKPVGIHTFLKMLEKNEMRL